VGKNNGEFDENFCSGCPNMSYSSVSAILSQPLDWSYNQANTVSLQYNPDGWNSFSFQNYADWFQTLIFANKNYGGCIQFSTEVYWMVTWASAWREDYPTSGCRAITGILGAGANWTIRETTSGPNLDNRIVSVVYSGKGSNGASMQVTMPIPSGYPGPWIWINSNACFCGIKYGGIVYNANFTSARGVIHYRSNLNVTEDPPPSWAPTSEDSNVIYFCMLNPDTQVMSQYFGLTGNPGTGCEPSISTALSSSIAPAGSSIYDTATLTGAYSTAGGNVTYRFFTGAGCTGNSYFESEEPVTDGVVPNSYPWTFNKAGLYGWIATYSGDSADSPATSPCERLGITGTFHLNEVAHGAGIMSPGSGNYSGSVQISAFGTCFNDPPPLRGSMFDGWTGTGNGSYTGYSTWATIEMYAPITETAKFVSGVQCPQVKQP
jgi:hypothetical protein